MKFSVGCNFLYLETYCSLCFSSLPHLHCSFSHLYLRPKQVHTWGVLPPGEKASPLAGGQGHHRGAASLGKVCSQSQQQVSVAWHVGPRDHCRLHDTSKIQQSVKTDRGCNKATKIYFITLFRICEIFNLNSVRQFSPSIHTKTQRQLYNSKKPTVKSPE